jgi:hypothetical protein
MKRSIIIVSLIAFYAIFSIVYFLFFAQTGLYFIFMVIGSVAVLSTGTVFAVIEHLGSQNEKERESKFLPKRKTIKQIPNALEETSPEIIEEYFEAMPYLKEYIESDRPYEEIPIVKDLIFSTIKPGDLSKINLLNLSNFEKLEFLRELLYYDQEERNTLIESMLKNRGKIGEEVIYPPPVKIIEIGEAIRAYIISLIEATEKRKLLIIDTAELISSVKERAGELFNYKLGDFLISSGGLILEQNKKIKDYDIADEDEIVLIPQRKD